MQSSIFNLQLKRGANGAGGDRARVLDCKLQIENRKLKKAFTLIELIMVLVIIAVVVALLGPQLTGFTIGRTTRNTATNILALTHYARTQAVTEGCTYRLNFDDKANSLFLTYESGGEFVAPGNDFGTPLNIDSSIKIDTSIAVNTDGKQFIEFRPTGRTDPATITLTDRYGSMYELACSSATEQFRILPQSELTK